MTVTTRDANTLVLLSRTHHTMTTSAGAAEFRLAFSDRGGLETLTGPLADARRIQNVLFGHPRAGDADFGLNLQSFLMEFTDDQTIGVIEDRARTLISTFCPGVVLRGLVVEVPAVGRDPAGRGTNTLIIGLSLGLASGGTYDFAVVGTKTAKSTVVSSLVL